MLFFHVRNHERIGFQTPEGEPPPTISDMTAVLAQPVLFLIVNQGRYPSRDRVLISSTLPHSVSGSSR
jgi:hypothetical protein